MRSVNVQHIGDEALFAGNSLSVSVLASDVPCCRPNSIYSTDDSINKFPDSNWLDGMHDTSCFILADETITQYHGAKPLWITPPPPFDPVTSGVSSTVSNSKVKGGRNKAGTFTKF